MKARSKRMSSLGTENAFVVLKEVNELKAKGKDIVSFCIGQPDFPTPEHICTAAKQAIDANKHGYTPSPGIPELRAAIAADLSQSRGIKIDPEWVVVAAGAKPFIGYSIFATTDYGSGDEVLYPNPGFPIYESQIIANGAVPVALPLLESKGYNFDIETLRAKVSSKSKLLILNSPQNPTGGVLSRKELEAIAEICIEHDLWVFSDEVYSRLVYDGEFQSIASIPGMQDRTIIVDGASKTYAMTGWRIGYAASSQLAGNFSTLVTNTESCAGHINQFAALAAITGPQTPSETMAKTFLERRDVIVEGLNQIKGFRCLNPGGAFYVWPNVTEACQIVGAASSEEFRKKLLHEAGVAVLADIHFGHQVKGEGQHVRFSYASSKEDILKGLDLIKKFMAKGR